MSRYDWEKGTLKIPAREWVAFKRRFCEGVNRHQDVVLQCALNDYEKLMAAGKGKRNFDYPEAFNRITMTNRSPNFQGNYTSIGPYTDKIEPVLFPEGAYALGAGGKRKPAKPRRPLKKDFPLVKASKPGVVNVGDEGEIMFHEKEKSVTWDVPENNHAVERARNEPVAHVFFEALNKVTWTRGSGGVIVGNDEYNRDSDCPFGGSNYITQGFGPKGEAEKGFGGVRRVRRGTPLRLW